MAQGRLLVGGSTVEGVSGGGVPGPTHPDPKTPGRGLSGSGIDHRGSEPLRPYYTGDGIAVFHARFEDVLAEGLVPLPEVALVHADPVYGNGDDSLRSGSRPGSRRGHDPRGKTHEQERLQGNDRPYDPAPLLALDRPLVTWGANHYASRLPDSTAWIVWDKREDSTPDTGSDCELAWSNLGGALRCFRHVWRGLARASECGVPHLYPTQKPVALSAYVFQKARLRPGDLVLVPYLGSGPCLAAARAMGLRVIACDVSEKACRIAVSARLGAAPHPEPVEKLGALFDRART